MDFFNPSTFAMTQTWVLF